MKAKLIDGVTPGGKRNKLSDVLPLAAPYVVQIFPIYACNFKCEYCTFSAKISDRGFISDKVNMEFSLYKKAIDSISLFPSKIKVLRFVGMGEPLLHRDIADMISYAKKKDVADRIEILTNGSLLTNKMSNALIGSGLDRMVISLQGINAESYKKISNVDINFDEFLNNIKYFYSNKGKIDMYIKVMDIAINNNEEFFNVFGDMCDSIGIEHASPIFHGAKYNSKYKETGSEYTQFGSEVLDVKICPQAFFTMQINPDGNVVPCYSVPYPEIMGNCTTEDIVDIWNGKKYSNFRQRMLTGTENVCDMCKDCKIIKYRMVKEDMIDIETAKRLSKN